MNAQSHPRRLADSVSPYLRMHADDPVDWWPWSAEAFETAREQGKLVMLSVGYTACHWCHVMQRESFRDEQIAAYLNDRFVCVKADREERPDVDKTYQAYVQATAGAGGWPLTVFLSPEGAPLLGGTYFPRNAPEGMPSLLEVVDAVVDAWAENPGRNRRITDEALEFLRDQARPQGRGEITPHLVTNAAEQLMHWVDQENGGFGDAPKFPQYTLVEFLLDYAEVADDHSVLYQAERAVQAMIRGGAYDQATGGIFRYSTDARWLVPHFEKMLYDQGLLLSNLASIHRLRPEDEYAHEARRTAAFLERSLALPGGGFAASLSAETHGDEGATYVWDSQELADALSAEELALAKRYLGVAKRGPVHGDNVLSRYEGRRDDAEAVDALLDRIAELRASRPQPERDDKVVTSWNALAAKGLIEAGETIGDDAMLARGVETLEFLLANAVDGAEVVHVLGDKDVADLRLVEDYAALVAACLAGWDRADRDDMLDTARRLMAAARERFYEDGLVWMTSGDTGLPVRPREEHDDPAPSGGALLVLDAVRLARATGDAEDSAFAAESLPAYWAVADFSPFSAGTALTAMIEYLASRPE